MVPPGRALRPHRRPAQPDTEHHAPPHRPHGTGRRLLHRHADALRLDGLDRRLQRSLDDRACPVDAGERVRTRHHAPASGSRGLRFGFDGPHAAPQQRRGDDDLRGQRRQLDDRNRHPEPPDRLFAGNAGHAGRVDRGRIRRDPSRRRQPVHRGVGRRRVHSALPGGRRLQHGNDHLWRVRRRVHRAEGRAGSCEVPVVGLAPIPVESVAADGRRPGRHAQRRPAPGFQRPRGRPGIGSAGVALRPPVFERRQPDGRPAGQRLDAQRPADGIHPQRRAGRFGSRGRRQRRLGRGLRARRPRPAREQPHRPRLEHDGHRGEMGDGPAHWQRRHGSRQRAEQHVSQAGRRNLPGAGRQRRPADTHGRRLHLARPGRQPPRVRRRRPAHLAERRQRQHGDLHVRRQRPSHRRHRCVRQDACVYLQRRRPARVRQPRRAGGFVHLHRWRSHRVPRRRRKRLGLRVRRGTPPDPGAQGQPRRRRHSHQHVRCAGARRDADRRRGQHLPTLSIRQPQYRSVAQRGRDDLPLPP